MDDRPHRREPDMPSPDRLEREINEIMEHVGHSLPPEPLRRGAIRQPFRNVSHSISSWEHDRIRDLSRLPATRMLLIAFALLVGGFILDEVLPYEGYWMTIAGALLFVPAFALVVFRRDRRTATGERPKQK